MKYLTLLTQYTNEYAKSGSLMAKSNVNYYADLLSSGAYAKGGKYPGGWALVGEEGPELINFGQSGYVYTAAQTQQMMASERGGGSTTQINVGGGSTVVDLSAGSIQRIAQAVQPLIELDGQRVARSTNRNNQNLTRTGSN